ncbi:MAG: hypothetical protein HYS13_08730, partial [Planctomycetia bacterium]|nr:hypothetical protein [Planctomycetia bacterium]
MSRWLAATAFLAILSTIGCGDSSSSTSGAPSLIDQINEADAEPDADRRASRLLDIARQQRETRDNAGAEQSLGKARRACAEIKDPAARASRFAEVADGYARLNYPADAQRLLAQAGESAAAVADPGQKLGVLMRIADVQVTAKDLSAALNSAREAEKLLDSIAAAADADLAARNKSDALLALAELHHKIGRPGDVKRLVGLSQTMIAGIQQTRRKADALASLALAQHRLQMADSAASFEQALAAARQVGDPASRAHALCELAARRREAGQGDKVGALLDEASQAADQIKDSQSLRNEVLEKIAGLRR